MTAEWSIVNVFVSQTRQSELQDCSTALLIKDQSILGCTGTFVYIPNIACRSLFTSISPLFGLLHAMEC